MPAPFADSTTELVREFNAKHRGKINVNVTRGPLETEAVSDLAISSLLLGNSPFDIILVDVTWLPKYVAAGWLTPLDNWIKKEEIDALAPGANLGNKYDGKLYRWPLVADMGLLYWRTDLMSSPPRTPEELIYTTKRLQENVKIKYGFVWQGRQYEGLSCVFLEVLNGFGGNWLNNSNQVGLNNSAAIKAANWLDELIETGVSPTAVTNYSEPEALQVFESGDAALMRNWPYAWSELQKPGSAVKGKVGVTTMVATTEDNSTATLGSWGFSVLKSSTNPQTSAEVITSLTSSSAQKQLFIKYGYTPTKAKLYEDPELISNSAILSDLQKALSVTKPRPMTPLYAQISDVLQRQLSEGLTGQTSVDDAMNRAQSNTVKILSAAGESQ